MSKSVNKAILLGHLGKDVEVRYTQSGVACGTFSMATSRRWKQGEEWKEETDWHNVVMWRCEKLAEYLRKGTQVYVEGRLQARSWEKDGAKHWMTEVVVDELMLLGGKREGVAPRSADAPGPSDDEVPF